MIDCEIKSCPPGCKSCNKISEGECDTWWTAIDENSCENQQCPEGKFVTTGNDDLCFTDLKCVEKVQCWPKPDCPVPHLATECELQNHEELLFCYTFNCHGEPPYSDCYSDCNRQSVEDLKNCPCYEKCSNGCAGCDHSICNSEEKCETDQLTIKAGFSHMPTGGP